MPIRHAVWSIGVPPKRLVEASLVNEKLLESMIEADMSILSNEWMLIGRQVPTFGGRPLDLLALAPDGSLVLIENKRDRTPREVVAQALDYASWVEKLRPDEIAAIYSRFAPGCGLAEDFRKRFGRDLDEESLNDAHQIVIVASSLDDSTERIVKYLSDRGISINVLFFQVFTNGTEQLISRAWLLDPVLAQGVPPATTGGITEPWNGEWYANFGGDSETRSWDEAVRYGFVCAGGGTFYTGTLQKLNPSDRVWVNAPGSGYVGVGLVTGRVQSAATFRVMTPEGEEVPVLDVVKGGTYHREYVDDPERCEYFVPMRWLQTVPLGQAVREVGLFGNQNTVSAPTSPKWRSTIERLKEKFPNFDNP